MRARRRKCMYRKARQKSYKVVIQCDRPQRWWRPRCGPWRPWPPLRTRAPPTLCWCYTSGPPRHCGECGSHASPTCPTQNSPRRLGQGCWRAMSADPRSWYCAGWGRPRSSLPCGQGWSPAGTGSHAQICQLLHVHSCVDLLTLGKEMDGHDLASECHGAQRHGGRRVLCPVDGKDIGLAAGQEPVILAVLRPVNRPHLFVPEEHHAVTMAFQVIEDLLCPPQSHLLLLGSEKVLGDQHWKSMSMSMLR